MNIEKIILENTRYGHIKCYLKKIMNEKRMSIYQLSRLADIKFEIIERYCNNQVVRYDTNVLCRLCYSLDCDLSEIIRYNKK